MHVLINLYMHTQGTSRICYFKKITQPRHDRRVAICFIFRYTCRCIFVYTHIFMYTHTGHLNHFFSLTYTYICIPVYLHTNTHTGRSRYECRVAICFFISKIHMNMYTHTYICIHTQDIQEKLFH